MTKTSKNNMKPASNNKTPFFKNNVFFKNKVFLSLMGACVLGAVYLSANFSDSENFQAAPVPQVSSTPDNVEEKEIKSTSQLIEKVASQYLDEEKQDNTEYPNITPVTLEDPFSPTLVGTDIDGQIRVGDDGKVELNLAVKDFFDYFLSAVGEVSAELALDELMKVISRSLPPENAKEAIALLDNYLAYKQAAVELMAQPMLPEGQQTREYQLQVLQDSLGQLKALRRAHMPEEQVDAFFGLEEAYEEYTIATINIQFDDSLSNTEKAQLIDYQRSLLPEMIRDTETRVAQDQEQNAEIHQAIASADEEELESTLDQHGYTEEQKEQVLAHRRQQEAFDQRYAAYASERADLLDGVTNPDEKARILDALQSEYFETEQELTQARVRDLRS